MTTPDFTSAPKDFRGGFSTRERKPYVRLATAAALAAYTRVGNTITANANGAMANVDGVAPAVGDRILLKNGAAGADNGIYEVVSLGGASARFVLERAWDMDTTGQVAPGTMVYVAAGTANGAEWWYVSTATEITLNTTSMTWAQLVSA